MTVWIFTHGDGDGICASSLALAANPSARLFFTHPYGLLEDLEQTENGDTVIICDIALSQAHLGNLIDKFAEIEDEGFIYYFDHHPLPEDFNVEDIPGNI
ncbi:TPA: phosphoesterase, partial [Candidatus Bathyarchaeota archaeon]|nr:phosphoesterase [Candidatus Bathyarchaeota archaeon]